jgi:hypothetical protein
MEEKEPGVAAQVEIAGLICRRTHVGNVRNSKHITISKSLNYGFLH